MSKIIETLNAPKPIGPYSQAVIAGDLAFLSGQIAINPNNGELIQGSITEETHQIMLNIEAVLKATGLTMSSIIKTSIFLKAMDDFNEVNEEYAKWFTSAFPARETIAVAGLPKNVRVEISVIAQIGS